LSTRPGAAACDFTPVVVCWDITANILVIANWISDTGISERTDWLRKEFLTGTAVAVILVLLILLVGPRTVDGKAIGFARRCPVCEKRFVGDPSYCGEFGQKI
jgi:hypothetical protein